MAASFSKTLKLSKHVTSLSSIPRLPQPPPPSPASFSISQSAAAAAAAATRARSQENKKGAWAKALLFLPGAITFGLGTWQLFRRQEKIEMLDFRRKRLEMQPVAWNEVSCSLDGDLEELEFRKILCEGVFDGEKSVYVGPRSRSISGVTENGYYLITPLVPASSETGSVQLPILVNRGWVPRGWRDKPVGNSREFEKPKMVKTKDLGNIEGSSWWKFWSKKPTVSMDTEPSFMQTRVIGVIRGSEKPSIFVPANDPKSGQWFYVDVPMIACACGLPENTLYIEDINDDVNPTHPYPVPKDVNTLIHHSVMPQDHLNYTFTWYSLSAAVTFMAYKRIRPGKTRR